MIQGAPMKPLIPPAPLVTSSCRHTGVECTFLGPPAPVDAAVDAAGDDHNRPAGHRSPHPRLTAVAIDGTPVAAPTLAAIRAAPQKRD